MVVSIGDSIIHTGDTDTSLRFPSADTITLNTGNLERARVDSSGRLLLGTTTEGESSADDLTIANSSDCGITIRSGSSDKGKIFFSDATSGAGEYDGYIQYQHSDGALRFGTGGGERLRITSGGDVGIGTAAVQDSSGLTTKLAVGIVTAKTLYGDGSNLTGIAAGGSGQFNTGLTGATALSLIHISEPTRPY